jgi:hypothetical protein
LESTLDGAMISIDGHRIGPVPRFEDMQAFEEWEAVRTATSGRRMAGDARR